MKYWKMVVILSLLSASITFCTQAQVSGNSQYPGSQAQNSRLRQGASYQYMEHSTKNFTGTEDLKLPLLPEDNEISISVSGIYNALPDEYVAAFSIIQAGESAELTDQMMHARIEAFRQGIRSMGVRDEDIYVDMISFIPKYEYALEHKVFSKTYNEVPSGFELQKNVSIRYKEPQTLDKLISIAAKSEIYDLIKVDCFVRNPQPIKDSLKTRCISELHEKMKLYKSLGFRLDTLKKTISENFDRIYPQTRYTYYTAFSRPLPPPLKKNSQFINENEKAVSQYYKALDYNTFDIIFNPTVLEPPIQVIYRLSVRYFLPKDQKGTEAHYLVTPLAETPKPVR